MEPGPARSFHPGNRRRAAVGIASPNKREYPLDPVPRPAVIVTAAAAIRWRASPPRPTSRDRRGRKPFRSARRWSTRTCALQSRDRRERCEQLELDNANRADNAEKMWADIASGLGKVGLTAGLAGQLVPDPVLNADGSNAGAVGPTSVGGRPPGRRARPVRRECDALFDPRR
jgi:hypothetical protein